MNHIHEKDKSFYLAIGRIGIEAGRLEATLSELANILVNPDEPLAGQAFTTHIPLNRLIDAVLWLYIKRNGEPSKHLRSLLDRVSTLSKQRNEIIHSKIFIGDILPGLRGLPVRTRFENQSRKGPILKHDVIRVSDLNSLADKFSDTSKEIVDILEKQKSSNLISGSRKIQ